MLKNIDLNKGGMIGSLPFVCLLLIFAFHLCVINFVSFSFLSSCLLIFLPSSPFIIHEITWLALNLPFNILYLFAGLTVHGAQPGLSSLPCLK